ncbi:MAG: 23S rRNA (pseudouridine(1915)-N(3))-methyltransferase RlmH [Prevotella sp.]|nr:23S rRNA (pseudouridine(1915)-N(3))-methyltransferase RlmH [Prevotella sp.]
MKAELIVVGKTTDARIAALTEEYVGRTGHYMPFAVSVIPELKNTKSLSQELQKEMEGERILRLVQPADRLVLLDERGKEYSSRELADWLRFWQQTAKRLVFVVGGPFGFSQAVYARADELLSLSRMTFSHQMVRLFFAEQLYRACTIIKGEPITTNKSAGYFLRVDVMK